MEKVIEYPTVKDIIYNIKYIIYDNQTKETSKPVFNHD